MSNRFLLSGASLVVSTFWLLGSVAGCAQQDGPKWYQEYEQARAIAKTDGESADRLYHQAVSDLNSDPSPMQDASKSPIKLLEDYGSILFEGGRFEEANRVYGQALRFGEKHQVKTGRGMFLLRLAACQNGLYQEGDPNLPDTSLIEQALANPPETSPSLAEFRARCHVTLGLIYLDRKEFAKAQSILTQSLNELSALGLEYRVAGNIGILIEVCVAQGKYTEANQLFIKAYREHKQQAGTIRSCYQHSFWIKELTDSSMHPKIERLWRQLNFAELEKCAAEELSSRSSFSDGMWYLDAFYGAIDKVSYLPALQEWVETRPQSTTAKLALAQTLITYGWNARGNGWAQTVSDQGWNRMGERLKQAARVLTGAQKDSPYWYATSEILALGQGWPHEKYDALVADCRKKFPGYDNVLFQKALYLLPRWHGEDGETEKFVDEEANKRPAPEGDIFYARTVWSLDKTIGNIFEQTKLSWPRTKAGLKALIKKNPNDYLTRSVLSILAMEVGDVATAESAFQD